jgi:hypothetical protein
MNHIFKCAVRYIFESGNESISECSLVLCKEHKKRFEWLGKNVYSKEERSDMVIQMLLLQLEKTDDTCMWCENPEKFDPYTGRFEWMSCENERRKTRCNHQWNYQTMLPGLFSDRGILPDGRVIRCEECPKCGSVRYHILKENDPDSLYVKRAALEKVVSPDGIFCGNCTRFCRSHSFCEDFYTVRPPFSTCNDFRKGLPKGECSIKNIE